MTMKEILERQSQVPRLRPAERRLRPAGEETGIYCYMCGQWIQHPCEDTDSCELYPYHPDIC